jgi:hypothetical protein
LPQTPISQSATVNNAAKDDVLGNDGVYHYTYAEMLAKLLANDPGGANKLADHFFFGSTAPANGGVPTVATQAAYLEGLGIHSHLNADGSFASFDVGVGAQDFDYFVQMGNKGTWSEAHVDVSGPDPHLGPALFTENFDGYNSSVQQTYQDGGVDVFASVNLAAASGWHSTGSDAGAAELGANGYGGIPDTSPGAGGFWMDTQNSPGQVNISHDFTDTTAAVAGKTAVLEFDIAKQNLTYQGVNYATASDASFEFRIDDVAVATIHASDLVGDNVMHHQTINLAGYADMTDNVHTISLVDTSSNQSFTGFAIDSIQIHDWIV